MLKKIETVQAGELVTVDDQQFKVVVHAFGDDERAALHLSSTRPVRDVGGRLACVGDGADIRTIIKPRGTLVEVAPGPYQATLAQKFMTHVQFFGEASTLQLSQTLDIFAADKRETLDKCEYVLHDGSIVLHDDGGFHIVDHNATTDDELAAVEQAGYDAYKAGKSDNPYAADDVKYQQFQNGCTRAWRELYGTPTEQSMQAGGPFPIAS